MRELSVKNQNSEQILHPGTTIRLDEFGMR